MVSPHINQQCQLKEVSYLREFLLRSRRAYLNLPPVYALENELNDDGQALGDATNHDRQSPFPAKVPTQMGDRERDELENVSHSFVSACLSKIDRLSSLASMSNLSCLSNPPKSHPSSFTT